MITEHPCHHFMITVLETFDRVAGGMPPDCPKSVLSAMLENGLLRRTVRVAGKDSLGPIMQYGYSVPALLQRQWCDFNHQDIACLGDS
jgi:hypothetical protein